MWYNHTSYHLHDLPAENLFDDEWACFHCEIFTLGPERQTCVQMCPCIRQGRESLSAISGVQLSCVVVCVCVKDSVLTYTEGRKPKAPFVAQTCVYLGKGLADLGCWKMRLLLRSSWEGSSQWFRLDSLCLNPWPWCVPVISSAAMHWCFSFELCVLPHL